MSLILWLPLNRDLRNQGTKDVNITNSNAVIDDSGKLGKCYSFNGAYLEFDRVLPNPCSAFSIAGWVKLNSGYAANNGFHLISFQETYGRICVSKDKLAVRVLLHKDSTNYLGGSSSAASTLTSGVWNHYAVTFDNGVVNVYINGQLDSTNTIPFTSITLSSSVFRVGTYASESAKGCANDIRLYDHALSVNEVKELAKGLVCHYKLDDPHISDNLIVNGYGELGSENWNDANKISTTEIPPNHSEIEASFYNGAITTEYIPISSNHSYTISGYIKAMSGKTGTTYPSIYPYDADKKFINAFNSAEGFNATYKTTLAQSLHKGDTVIYATDLSKWTTADNYYNYCAIFGYKDSFGTVYDDFVYTHDAPQFATKGSTKTNIDKTNNTITLNSAYTGEDRPVGTTIVQATASGTYWYPFSGIALSSIQDWTEKTRTFTPIEIPRLKACKYIRWSTYASCYIAGNKLTDNTDTTTTVTDSSGYGNNGTVVNSLSVSNDTPRASKSTHFDGTSYSRITSISNEISTVSVWVKWDVIPTGQSVILVDSKSRIGLGLYSGGILCGSASGTYKAFSKASIVANTWYHFVVVSPNGYSDTTRKLYINGVEQTPLTATSVWSYGVNELQLGKRSTTSDGFVGRISDFRMYATPLSEDAIKELYEVGAKIDKNGNMYGYELKEG